MNFNPEPIKNWFGFTRRERRSTFTLLLIIVIVIAVRYIIPDRALVIDEITDKVLASARDSDTLSEDHLLSSFKPVSRNLRHRTSYFSSTDTGAKKRLSKVQNRPKTIIEINSCDSASLVVLPGIGPVLSARIIRYRKLLGGYASVDQLKEVYGLSPETFSIIRGQVTADTGLIDRININAADFRQLAHVRYLEKYEITSILKYRQLKGHVSGIQELIDNKILTEEKAETVGPYMKYRE